MWPLARSQTAIYSTRQTAKSRATCKFYPYRSAYYISAGMTSGGGFNCPRIVPSCYYDKETTLPTDLHPCLLRQCMQITSAIPCITNRSTVQSLYICTRTQRFPLDLRCHASLTSQMRSTVTARSNTVLLSSSRRPLVVLTYSKAKGSSSRRSAKADLYRRSSVSSQAVATNTQQPMCPSVIQLLSAIL
jgi:hypothetical protein